MKLESPLAVALLIVGFLFFLLGLFGGSMVHPNGGNEMATFYLVGGMAAIVSGILLQTARSRR